MRGEAMTQEKLDAALHKAAWGGHGQVAGSLLASGALVDAVGENGWHPLHEAALHGHTEVAELLIAHGADVNAVDNGGNRPLHLAMNRETAELLLACGAKVGTASKDGRQPLHHAALLGYQDVVELLLERGADPTALDNYGAAPHAGCWQAAAKARLQKAGREWKARRWMLPMTFITHRCTLLPKRAVWMS